MAYRQRPEPGWPILIGIDLAREPTAEQRPIDWPEGAPSTGKVSEATVTRTRHPLNLDGLIAWLEGKDQSEWYNWHDSCSCLIAQFTRAVTGSSKAGPFGDNFAAVCGGSAAYVYIGAAVEPGTIGTGRSYSEEWTFGKALQRARNIRNGYAHQYQQYQRAYYMDRAVVRGRSVEMDWMT